MRAIAKKLSLTGVTAVGLAAVITLSGCCSAEPAPRPAKPRKANCVDVALPTADRASSVIWIEKCGPEEVRANNPFEYSIKVTNLKDDIVLRDVVVLDYLPGPFRLTDGGADGGRGAARFDLGDLGPNQSRTIQVRGVATATETLVNCVTAEYQITACLSTRVVAPALSLDIAGPSDLLICEESTDATITITVRNTGTGTTDNVQVTALLPNELQLMEGNSTFNAGSLASGETKTFHVKARVTQPGAYIVGARAVSADGLATSADDLRFAARESRINVAASGPEMEYIGLPVEYNIQVTNTGDAPERRVVVESDLPAGVTFDAATEGGRPSGNKVVWDLGPMEPGASRNLAVRYVTNFDQSTQIRNTVTAIGECGSDSAIVNTDLHGVPALLVEAVDVHDPHLVGSIEEYHVTVTNQGSAPETNVKVVARLPDQMSFIRTTGPTESRVDGATITFEPLPNLPPKAKATWTVFARCEAPGDVRFAISVTSDQREVPIQETEATSIYH